MDYSNDSSTHFGQSVLVKQQYSDNSAADKSSCNNGDNEYDAFANIFSTNLDDLLDFTDDYKISDETEEMIADAMSLPQEERERRLKEIDQHNRFLKGKEKREKILKEKKHRTFDDSNIGLCSVCLDDNFQIVYPLGRDMACVPCFRKAMEVDQ